MLENDEDEARATSRIIDIETGETVGFIYLWEDGSEQPFWLNGACKNVTLTELEEPE